MNLNMFIPEVQILEKIVRPMIVYFFLLVAFRVAGKRELGQMTPFDLIVLLTISNVLQNAMIGPDNSLSGGLIGGSDAILCEWFDWTPHTSLPSLGTVTRGRPHAVN
jgi:hypothetical protein